MASQAYKCPTCDVFYDSEQECLGPFYPHDPVVADPVASAPQPDTIAVIRD